MLAQEFLEASADRLPDKVALVCDDQRLTYAEIEARANQLAHALMAGGVRRGDRVVIWLPNSVEAVVSIFAALKAGAVFVALNPATKRDKLVYVLDNCQASALIAPGPQVDLVAEVAGRTPSLRAVALTQPFHRDARLPGALAFPDVESRFRTSRPRHQNIDLDLACLIYTSGSTGDPKGVMCDHSNVVFASGSIIQYLENTEDDVVINALPLSFDYGLYQLLMVFRFGGTLVLEKGFAFPSQILRRIETERVTGFPGVPTLFAVLLQMDLSAFDVSSLRYLTNTAAALPPAHITELRARFPHARLYSMYGLTETKRTLYLPPEELDRRPGSVGIAIPGTEVWLVDEDGNRLPNGSVGELVVRGRHVMRGYWGDPDMTARRYRPGPIPGERVCYTGDLFRSDEEGYMYFIARKDDIIKSRGEKVAPKEVETVLYQLKGVTEAAVIGVPDPLLGQAVKAFVVLAGGHTLTEAEVIRHCRAHLEDFMVPKYVEFLPELPRTSSGKIKKTDLR